MTVLLVVPAAALGAAAYLLQVRYGVWRWLAGLAASAALLVVLLSPDTFDRPGRVWWFVAACLASALLGAAGVGRAGASGLQVVIGALLLATAPLLVVDLTLDLPWLALFGVLVAWPAAGALGLTALLSGRRSPAASRPQSDEVDEEALLAFTQKHSTQEHSTQEHGGLELGPVVIVIAAYDEERGIGEVLGSLPDQVLGLHTDVLVVDDHSTDATADVVAASPRALVVRCSRNRGQGAALRLGYRIAREHGAAHIVTTDADGQYDAGDISAVLAPIVEGRADFVTGSRRLGKQATRDRVRRLGVHVFAWILSAMAGQRITDTSFGLRAMRAEVTRAVTLNQPQYQSSELMLGVISHGFRLMEVPATMQVRSAGASKKGRNLVYGRRYARVVVGTWWREGCPRPVAERAPAFRRPEAEDARDTD